MLLESPSSSLEAEVSEVQVAGYRLLRELGDGGQGSVWEAVRESDERRVALKVFHHHLRAELAERARQEARILASINDAGLPAFVEIVEDASAPVAVAMELIDGSPMTTAFAVEPLTDLQKRGFLVELARILALLHGRGIVHRDVKPANVLVRPSWRNAGFRGSVVLVDLALAKDTSSGQAKTQAGLVMGTPAYLPPELLLGTRGSADATFAVDVFGWGVVAWELLFGHHPTGFSMDSPPADYMSAYLGGNQVWLRPLATEAIASNAANVAVVTAAIRALRDDPSSRPQNGTDLLTTLEQWGPPTGVAGLGQPGRFTSLKVDTWTSHPESGRASTPQSAPQPSRPSLASAPSVPGSRTDPATPSRAGSASSIVLLAGAAIVVVGILATAIVGFLLLRDGETPTASAPSTSIPGPPPKSLAPAQPPTPPPTLPPAAIPEPDPPSAKPRPARGALPATAREVSVSLTVTVDSSKSNGNPWDVGSGPDPMLVVTTANNPSYSFSFQDQFTVTRTLKLKLKPGDTVTISVYDRDVAFNDFVGSYTAKYSGPGTRNQGRGGSATFKVAF